MTVEAIYLTILSDTMEDMAVIPVPASSLRVTHYKAIQPYGYALHLTP
jgi:hypothetical protein